MNIKLKNELDAMDKLIDVLEKQMRDIYNLSDKIINEYSLDDRMKFNDRIDKMNKRIESIIEG